MGKPAAHHRYEVFAHPGYDWQTAYRDEIAMTIDNTTWDPAAIQAFVDGLDPIDWQQLELLARIPPEKRVLAGMQAQAFAMAALRGTFARRFPELTQSELNMKVLAYLTPVRMGMEAVSDQPSVDAPEDK